MLRTIKVKTGTSNYKLVGDGGTPLGVLQITYEKERVQVAIAKRYGTIKSLVIGTVAPKKNRG